MFALHRRLAGGSKDYKSLYFNTTTGICQAVQTLTYEAPAETSLDNSVVARWLQKRCEPGFYCQNGVRYYNILSKS